MARLLTMSILSEEGDDTNEIFNTLSALAEQWRNRVSSITISERDFTPVAGREKSQQSS